MKRFLLASLCVSAWALAPGAAQAAFPGDNGGLVFTRTIYNDCDAQRPCGDHLMAVNPDGSNLTERHYPGTRPAASPDGTKLAFTNGSKVFVSNLDGSGVAEILDWGAPVGGLAWSPDGTRIAASMQTCEEDECREDIYTFNADGSDVVDITPDLLPDRDPAWSPDGTKIAFGTVRSGDFEVFVMNDDGTGLTNLSNSPGTSDRDPSWSPDGTKLAFESTNGNQTNIWRMNSDGSSKEQLTNSSPALSPAWSPDGTQIAFAKGNHPARRIQTIDTGSGSVASITSVGSMFDDDFPEWTTTGPSTPPPPPDAYVRPRGATPFSTFLVPAFQACTSPTTTHGPPLAFPSCGPPSQVSDRLTIGTPETNGAGARARGWLRMRVLRGNPTNSWDDADVELILDTSDVRRVGSLADYGGELELRMRMRLTDRASGAGPDAGTIPLVPLTTAVPCETNTDPLIGSSCRLDTTLDSLFGGNAVIEGARGIWELEQIQLLDGGPDDMAWTVANRLFEVPGLFVP